MAMRMEARDRELARIAASQHGLLTVGQLAEHGINRQGVHHRVQSGRLERVGRSVYRVCGAPDTALGRALAAVLVAGPDGALSGTSAAALHQLPGFSVEPLSVTSPRGRRTRATNRPSAESKRLPAHHVTRISAIRVTTVERTLFDLCGIVHARRAERTLDTALARGMVDLPRLGRVLHELAKRGRSGSALFRELLEERGLDYVPPESELEARFLEMVAQWGLEPPERQVDLGWEEWIGRVDFLWRCAALVVEVDGAAYHGSLSDRRTDARRDEAFARHGIRVLRFSWYDVVQRPAFVVGALVAHGVRAGVTSLPYGFTK
jgi:predicted transcriptional regulator of viral defense system